MARSIGNRVAPARFIAFLALLVVATPAAAWALHRLADDPWREALEAEGMEIHTGTTATRVERDAGIAREHVGVLGLAQLGHQRVLQSDDFAPVDRRLTGRNAGKASLGRMDVRRILHERLGRNAPPR